MDTLLNDLRHGLRALLKTPGLTAIAALSLALGIGANTTIFSAVNALLLRPLPFEDPDRVIRIMATVPERGWDHVSLPFPDVADLRRESSAFQEIAAYQGLGVSLTGGERPERIDGVVATAPIFDVLRVRPALGRAFTAAEDRPDGERVIVLSHGLWQRRFGSRRDVIGTTVHVAGRPHTVLGVMPPDFTFFGTSVDFIAPLRADESVWPRERGGLTAVGRLRHDVSLDRAHAELSGIARRLEEAHPATNHGRGIGLYPVPEEVYGPEFRLILYVLLGAVGLVLLIACINIANLLLVRGIAREREIAIRAALGAGRARVVRQLLTESMILALIGGAAGTALALWGTDLLTALLPSGIARADEIGLDARVLGYAFVITLLTGIVAGVVPALQSARTDLQGVLARGARGTSSERRGRIRRVLVSSEVALALVLLVAAGLMVRTMLGLFAVDTGFDARNLLTLRITLDREYKSAAEVTEFHRRTFERIRALPGVVAAGGALSLPLAGLSDDYNDFRIEGRTVSTPADQPNAGLMLATDGYLEAMGIPVLRGRAFTPADRAGSLPVVLINQRMARQFFPGEDPVGKRIVVSWEDGAEPIWRTVVGVVGDVRHSSLDQEPRAEFYLPYAQLGWAMHDIALVARAAGDPGRIVPAVRAAVLAADPNQPVYDVATMTDRIGARLAAERAFTAMLGLFAGLALLLATVGLYGVISHNVTQRTREIGIRAALGASQRSVLRMVIGQAMTLVGAGLAFGLVAAVALARVMRGLLFGIGATDLVTFATVTAVLIATALLACWLPARRAIRVDPVIALRME